ncbi:MAG: hypothetical protein JXA96_14190 [Sedimentisphaerales bacterium]|nr:hypothetical protein [Sedimentisphaerales bacterium]
MKNKLIVVLGMHRSGTSAIARGIRTLGCEFGDTLWPANVSNRKGFYENIEITKFNDELLRLLGVEWHSVAQIPAERFNSPNLDSLRDQAKEILNRHFGKSPLSGFKCLRICRLLPFWQRVFSEMKIKESYVIAIRNPLSIAESLDARNGFSHEKSFLLWLLHILPVIKYTNGLPRVVVDYDIMMDNPISQLKRIAGMLAIEIDPAQEPALNEFATSFLEENLRHTRFTLDDMTAETCLLKLTRQAYSLLLNIAGDEGAFDDIFDENWQKIEHTYEHDDSIANLTGILNKCDRQIIKLMKIVAERGEQLSELTHAIACRDEQIAALTKIAEDCKQTFLHKLFRFLKLRRIQKNETAKKD